LNVFFDTSIWIDHFRHDILSSLLPLARQRYLLWTDPVVIAEIMAGCRSRRERREAQAFASGFGTRIASTGYADFIRAAEAISKLREKGVTLKSPGSSLMDALIAVDVRKIGALLVTHNLADFQRLRAYIPLTVESLDDFRRRLWSTRS